MLGITTKASSVNSAAMMVCTHTAVSGTRALFTWDIAFGSRFGQVPRSMRRGLFRLDVRKFIKEAHSATFGRPPPRRNRLTSPAACHERQLCEAFVGWHDEHPAARDCPYQALS